MTISDDTFYKLTDYVEKAIVEKRAPTRDSVFGVVLRFLNCFGLYMPGVDRIFVNPIGTLEEEAWVYVHEVAHWALRENGIRSDHADEEQVCDDIAFIILERQGLNLFKLV